MEVQLVVADIDPAALLPFRTSGKEGQVDDPWPDSHLRDCEMRERVRNSNVLAETETNVTRQRNQVKVDGF